MKDFNKLTLFGEEYSKEVLLKKAHLIISAKPFEEDFWSFIKQWLNEKDYIMVLSSGSTGEPKKIQISKEKMILSAKNTCHYLNLKTKDIALLCMSCKHIGGMMMVVRAFYAKLDLHVVKAESNPLSNLQTSPNFVALVPYQVRKILELDASKLKAIENIIIGGGTIDEALEMKIEKHKINAFSTFGMTETISHFALKKIGQEDYYTCLPNIEVSLSKNETLIVHAPEILETPIETNDLVEIIENDKFRWLGRLDFAIESGGLKVIPEMLEKKLENKINATFIISSLPHKDLGQSIVLLIEGLENTNLPENIFENFGKYEIPKKVLFLKRFSYTDNGKINRIKTRNQIL